MNRLRVTTASAWYRACVWFADLPCTGKILAMFLLTLLVIIACAVVDKCNLHALMAASTIHLRALPQRSNGRRIWMNSTQQH